MEELLGPTLLTDAKGAKEDTAKALKDKDIVALYFSASWCPPCQSFTPIFVDFYKTVAESEKFEVVYVASDKTVQEFEQYYSKMPWLAIPGDNDSTVFKNNLAQTFKVTGIPTLIILDPKTGNFISKRAAMEIRSKHKASAEEQKSVVKEWKATEAVPLDQANLDLDTPTGGIKGFLTWIVKNPMFILAIFYGYKWLARKFRELHNEGDQAGEQEL